MDIERSNEGDLYKNFGLVITKDGETISKESNYELQIKKKQLTREEAEKQLLEAFKEIQLTFAGDNVDFEHIRDDVKPEDTYADGEVTAEWVFDGYDYLSLDGKYNHSEAKTLPDDGQDVKVRVRLDCQGYDKEMSFTITVLPPAYSLEDSIKEEIQKAVNGNPETAKVILPETVVVNDVTYHLKWTKSRMDSPIFLIVAVVMLAALAKYELKERKLRVEQKRKRRLQMEYPEIVSEFALLLGAGMNIRTVLKEISGNGEHEEISQVLLDVENGYSEYQAFYRMADRCDLKCYRRLSSLITQNIMLGGKHLSKMLLKEAEKAYDERKNLAITMGEEAGTKMMIPMFMMLGIVLTVSVLPAFLSMNI